MTNPSKKECKITQNLIVRNTGLKRNRNESAESFFNRITNVNLQEKGITDISNLQILPSLRILFLYQNRICDMSSLNSFSSLTHVYLQNNRIKKIDGLSFCRNLVKLRLENNRIKRIEGLRNCRSLEEFHINDQVLEPGATMEFDSDSLEGIADSLTFMNISGNRVTSILPLCCLTNLQVLKAERNYFIDMTEFKVFLEHCSLLSDLSLRGNPISDHDGYRDYIIMNSEFLQNLDDKGIQSNQRAFLQARESRRAQKREMAQSRLAAQSSLESFASKSASSLLRNESTLKPSRSIPNLPGQITHDQRFLPKKRPNIKARAKTHKPFRVSNISKPPTIQSRNLQDNMNSLTIMGGSIQF